MAQTTVEAVLKILDAMAPALRSRWANAKRADLFSLARKFSTDLDKICEDDQILFGALAMHAFNLRKNIRCDGRSPVLRAFFRLIVGLSEQRASAVVAALREFRRPGAATFAGIEAMAYSSGEPQSRQQAEAKRVKARKAASKPRAAAVTSRKTAAPAFEVGMEVRARYPDTPRYYVGTIRRVTKTKAMIKWKDGDEPCYVDLCNIRLHSPKKPTRKGS